MKNTETEAEKRGYKGGVCRFSRKSNGYLRRYKKFTMAREVEDGRRTPVICVVCRRPLRRLSERRDGAPMPYAAVRDLTGGAAVFDLSRRRLVLQ